MKAKILEGNVLETLKDLPDCSVQCVVTSPPYYGLRDYGMEGQIGLEATPEAYVENLVNVFRECRRALKNDGVLWLNLGDSYAGSGKGGQSDKKRSENWQPEYGNKGKLYGLKPKDLIGIPWMVAFALRADGWYLRQEIIWHKPNPMPESVTDRCTKSHEQIFLLSKSKSYFFDYEAIQEPSVTFENRPSGVVRERELGYESKRNLNPKAYLSTGIRFGGNKYGDSDDPKHQTKSGNEYIDTGVRNKRSVWTVATKPYKGAHFATYPPDLIEPCILAGTKEGDTVLDPFNGSGTTGEVAIRHNRFYIGCEINPDYVRLTNRRLSKVQPFMPAIRTTQPAPDAGESAPSQAFSTPDTLF